MMKADRSSSESGGRSSPPPRPVVAVVDCYSTGQFFPERLARRGFDCVHVISSATEREHYMTFAARLPLLATIVHGDDIGQTMAALGPYAPCLVLPGFEAGVELADALSEGLGLPTNGTALSAARRNKFLMKEALRARGLRTVDYYRGSSLDDLLSWAEATAEWPYVIKPLKGAGTDGVHFCSTPEDIAKWRGTIIDRSDASGGPNTEVLLEQRVKGVEFIMDTVSCHGQHFLTDFWQYRKVLSAASSPAYDFAMLQPYPGPEWNEDLRYLFGCLDALGIKNGPAHSELMLTADGIVLIETGARCAGASLSPDMMDECIGHNQVDLTLDCYFDPVGFCRRMATPYQLKKTVMLKLLISHQVGRVRAVPGLEMIRRLPSFYGADVALPGSSITLTVDMETSPGKVALVHENSDVVDEDYAVIRALEKEGLFEVETP